MAETTKIAWCDATFNPWVGCTKVSPACDHCYAEAWAKRSGHPELWTGERRRTTPGYWRQPIKWNRQAEADGVRRRVFCASLADVFDNQVPQDWRDDLFALIEKTLWLDWLLLTKRPQNIAKMMPPFSIATWDEGARDWGETPAMRANVWLGTTVENQEEADRRTPHLQAVPAHVRFLSVEPMLGQVFPDLAGISWVICGGESGSRPRAMLQQWVRLLRDRCIDTKTAFFMKQIGSNHVDWPGVTKKGDDPDQWPADLRIREFPMVRVLP